ncbi:MAG TPA: dTDP-4-dehydrorhamnose reductase, partial [Gammaproteobacteria bacterium]|nr:dTDP-4-dehydrorhamnose reductase [Gammaproteobacteria bacterium]
MLIFGRVGQVGSALAELLPDKYQVRFLDQPDIDLTVPGDVRQPILEYQPAIVINAAAYTAVDKAESEPELAQ